MSFIHSLRRGSFGVASRCIRDELIRPIAFPRNSYSYGTLKRVNRSSSTISTSGSANITAMNRWEDRATDRSDIYRRLHIYINRVHLTSGFTRRGSRDGLWSAVCHAAQRPMNVPRSWSSSNISPPDASKDGRGGDNAAVSFVGSGGLGGSQTPPNKEDAKEPVPPHGRLERLKAGWRKYGMVGVLTYVGLQASTIGLLWAGLEFDVLHTASLGFDVHTLISRTAESIESWTGNKEWAEAIRHNPQAGTFVLAYTIAQFTEPLRLLILVRIVPPLHAFFHKAK